MNFPQFPEIDYSNPLSEGLVLCYVDTQGYPQDLTGNTKPVIENSSGDVTPAIVDGLGVRSLNFAGDATNDRVDLGSIDVNSPLKFSSHEMTFFAWLNYSGESSTVNSFPRILDVSNGGNGSNGYAFWMNESNNRLSVQVNGTGARHDANNIFDSANDGIGLYALGYSMISQTSGAFYKNGSLFFSPTNSLGSFGTTTTNGAIGNWNHSTSRMMGGELPIVLLWNRVLSAEEHESLYNPATRFGLFKERVPRAHITLPSAGGGSDTNVLANSISLILTEQAANVNAETNIQASVDSLTLGSHASLVNTAKNVLAEVNSLGLTANQTNVALNVSVNASVDSLSLTENSAGISVGINVQANTANHLISAGPANVNAATNIISSVNELVLTEYSTGVSLGTVVNVSTTNLSLTENSAGITYDRNVQTITDALTIATSRALVSSGALRAALDIKLNVTGTENFDLTSTTLVGTNLRNIQLEERTLYVKTS